MSTYNFQPMLKEKAKQIATWKYKGMYSFYNMDESDDGIEELMNGNFYSASDVEGKIIGFICIGDSARVSGGFGVGLYHNDEILDFGLGLKPDYTGKGIGRGFVEEGIKFLQQQFKMKQIQLVVAEFNKRAIQVYDRAGFTRGIRFASKVKDREVEFISMRYMIKGS